MNKGYEQAVDNLAYHITLLVRETEDQTGGASVEAAFIFLSDPDLRHKARKIDRVIEAVAKEYDISEDSVMLDVFDRVELLVAALDTNDIVQGFFLK